MIIKYILLSSHLFFCLFVEIIRTERLRVVRLTSHSAVLEWHPVLAADGGYYELSYKAVDDPRYEKTTFLPSSASQAELTQLQPDTTYTASLLPESNQRLHRTLTVKFTTLPGKNHMPTFYYLLSSPLLTTEKTEE